MTLKSQIKKALTCDKKCGHTMSPEECFEHQVERVEKIVDVYKNESYEQGRDDGYDEGYDGAIEFFKEKPQTFIYENLSAVEYKKLVKKIKSYE